MEYNEQYMRRALRLAANGRGMTAPNPMVGAVIVARDGRIIGEGWHRRCGEGHAEVNAVASVKDCDRPLLADSTMYVTLEPCSHYGKTPPCARLIVETGIPRVVTGSGDPNPKVNGRGIAILRGAGIEVVTGVLAEDSIALNRVFFTSQILHRPFITLKWAQSQDGFMDVRRSHDMPAYAFSTPLTRLSTMKLRAENEAILTTAATVNADNPALTLRNWVGRQPRRFVLDRSGSLDRGRRLIEDGAVVLDGNVSPCTGVSHRENGEEENIAAPFEVLYRDFGVTSVLVEAGPRYLGALLRGGLWDCLRIETAPVRLGAAGVCLAPARPIAEGGISCREWSLDGHRFVTFCKRCVGNPDVSGVGCL